MAGDLNDTGMISVGETWELRHYAGTRLAVRVVIEKIEAAPAGEDDLIWYASEEWSLDLPTSLPSIEFRQLFVRSVP